MINFPGNCNLSKHPGKHRCLRQPNTSGKIWRKLLKNCPQESASLDSFPIEFY